MRAWKMTAGLAVVALVAAMLAPRLFPQIPPLAVAPGMLQPIVTVGEVPVVPQVPVVRQVPQVPEVPTISGIPELSTPIVPTDGPSPSALGTPPDPRLDEAWLDMVDCGMG